MSEKEDGSNFFFNGLMLGGIVGGVLGLLFAPGAGDETREKIRKKVEGLNLDSDQTIEEIKGKGEKLLEHAKSALMTAIERISLAVEEGKKASEEKSQSFEREDPTADSE